MLVFLGPGEENGRNIIFSRSTPHRLLSVQVILESEIDGNIHIEQLWRKLNFGQLPSAVFNEAKYLVSIVFFVYIPTKFDWIWRSVYKLVNLVKVIRRLADNFFGTVGNN